MTPYLCCPLLPPLPADKDKNPHKKGNGHAYGKPDNKKHPKYNHPKHLRSLLEGKGLDWGGSH